MTRVALIAPGVGDWWGLVEVPWARTAGPGFPKVCLPWCAPRSAAWIHPEEPFAIETGTIEVCFQQLRLIPGPEAPLWTATIEGPSEALRLLNIAYTCPETHVNWAEAAHLREKLEGALGATGGRK